MMLVFMVCNLLVSYLALNRYTQREEGIPAANQVQEWLDENYSDEVMERIYPRPRMLPERRTVCTKRKIILCA